MLSDPFASRHPIRGRSRSAVSRAIVALALAVPILSDAADADPPRSVSRADSQASPLVITGRVIDRETKRPIKSFRVVPAARDSFSWNLAWDPKAAVPGADGHYEIRLEPGPVSYALRIQADGYMSVLSKDILGYASPTSLDFELSKQRDVDVMVRTPDAAPAAKARVEVAWDASSVTFGSLRDVTRVVPIGEADDFGRFRFRQRETKFCLTVTHPTGYAIYRAAPNSKHRLITLDPWTRVEGRFRSGSKPISGVSILIQGEHTPDVDFFYVTQTDADGRFLFDRVPRGKGWIEVWGMEGTVGKTPVPLNSCCSIRMSFPLGKTMHIELGGSGRPVVGKPQPPDAAISLPWSNALVRVRCQGSEYETSSIVLMAKVDQEGGFRIEDVPAGSYTLEVEFDKKAETRLHLSQQFSVSIPDGKSEARPLDLRSLTLRN